MLGPYPVYGWRRNAGMFIPACALENRRAATVMAFTAGFVPYGR
jgi:hypothetical protein